MKVKDGFWDLPLCDREIGREYRYRDCIEKWNQRSTRKAGDFESFVENNRSREIKKIEISAFGYVCLCVVAK